MIRVIVIDDERRSAGMMKRLLEEIGGVEVLGVYTNPLEALRQLESGLVKPSAVFLDIEMPGMRGTELAQLIQNVDEAIHILFVTAYSEYAIEAFELHSLDYVLKPVSKERLAKSVVRLQTSLKARPSAGEAAAPMTIRCFGKFELRCPDGQTLKWRTAKTKELCAFLVHHAGHTVSRDLILDTLWSDTPMEKALDNLYTIMSYLRKMFADEGLNQVITKENAGYKMDLTHIRCDALEFRKAAKQSDPASLRQAVLLYEGAYMGEEQYEWALGGQEELQSQAFAVYGKLALACEAAGDDRQAALHAERWMQLAPYSDAACRQLMRIYAKAGRRSDALLCYQRYEAAVRDELDAEPDRETSALYASIARGGPA